MTQVNLLPPEVRSARRSAQATGRIRRASLLGLLLLGGIWGIRTVEVLQLRSDLGSVRSERATVEADLDALSDVATAESAVLLGKQLETALWRGEVSWSQLLIDVSTSVPPGFSLTSLNASAAPGGGPIIGTVTFTASATSTAQPRLWLLRISTQEGWTNGWLNAVQSDGAGNTTVNGSFDLTSSSITTRGGRQA